MVKTDHATSFHAIAATVPTVAATAASSMVAPLSKRANGRTVSANGHAPARPTRQNHGGAIPIAKATGNATAAAKARPMPHVRPRCAATAPPMRSSDAITVIQRSYAMLRSSVMTATACATRRERRTRCDSTTRLIVGVAAPRASHESDQARRDELDRDVRHSGR